jgi:hypothetical protein
MSFDHLDRKMPLSPFTIWTTPERTRYFLVPDSLTLPIGPFPIRAPLGKHQSVNPENLGQYELTEHQAKLWVASEITGLLAALPTEPSNAGDKILAAAHLVRALPELIRLSQSEESLSKATEKGAALDNLLRSAGIESHATFARLPGQILKIFQDPNVTDRLARISEELRHVSEQIETPALRRFMDNFLASAWRK